MKINFPIVLACQVIWGDNSLVSKQALTMATVTRSLLLPNPLGPMRSYPMKRLTQAEMLARQEKGCAIIVTKNFRQS